MIVLRTETRSLRCELTDGEIRERRTALAEREIGLAHLARQIKASKTLSGNLLESIAGRNPGAIRAEFETRYTLERIKQRELMGCQKVEKEGVSELLETLARGWESRDVAIEIRLNGRDVITLRTDTGELIDRRAATDDELRTPAGADREPGGD